MLEISDANFTMNDDNDSMLYSATNEENNFELTFEFKIILTALYIIVFICAFFGNLLVLFLFTRYKSLRTMTNFFLGNLAVADFMISIFCVIPQMLRSIYLISINLTVCRLNSYVQALCFTASIFTLVLISFERYIAIVHPIRSRQLITFTRLKILAAGIWIFSALYNLPYLIYHRFTIIELPDYSLRFCYIPKWDLFFIDDKSYQLFSIIIFYIVPLVLMITVYLCIIVSIFHRYKEMDKLNNESEVNIIKPFKSKAHHSTDDTSQIEKHFSTPKIQFTDVVGSPTDSPQHHSPLKIFNSQYLSVSRTTSRQLSMSSMISNDSEDTVYSRMISPTKFDFLLKKKQTSSPTPSTPNSQNNVSFTEEQKTKDPKNYFKCINIKCHKKSLKVEQNTRQSYSSNASLRHKNPQEAHLLQPSTGSFNTTNQSSSNKLVLESRQRIVKLLIVLLFCFAFNVLPYQIQLFITKFGFLEDYQNTKEFKVFVIFSFILYYANAGVNCFIYFMLSNRFRKYIIRTFTPGSVKTDGKKTVRYSTAIDTNHSAK